MITNPISDPSRAITTPLPINDPTGQQFVTETSTTSPATTSESDSLEISVTSGETEERAAGVLRKLESGHYKGVAAIRLRINFAEELAARQVAKQAPVVDEGVKNMMAAVETEMATLLSQEGLSASAVEEIEAALQRLMSEATERANSFSGNSDQLATGLRSAMEEFVGTVETAAVLTVEEAVTDEPTIEEPPVTAITSATADKNSTAAISTEVEVIDGLALAEGQTADETDPNFSVEQFIADLMVTFESGLVELSQALLETGALPEISEPNGNGRAFDKFMAIYESMRATEVSELPEPAFDAVA